MSGQRGFSSMDLCFGLACVAIAACLLLAVSGRLDKQSQLARAQNQLRWIAGVTTSYAADFEDRMWGLSWQAGEGRAYVFRGASAPPFSRSLDAVVYQAIDILDRRAGRTDMIIPTAWYPGSLYSHLPLLDYLERDGPDTSFVSPGDRHRLNWTKDPRELFDEGFWLPYQPRLDSFSARWPYSASFQAPPAMTSEPASGPRAIVSTTGSHHTYHVPDQTTLRGVRLTAVTFPAQKVLLHESSDWYFGDVVRYYADDQAKVNVLTADGSARALATADANAGWHPTRTTLGSPGGTTRFEYEPDLWEGPRLPTTLLTAHYRFTRGGPAGRDFGGPEIDTGQP